MGSVQGNWNIQRGDLEWQHYGWEEGAATSKPKTEKGNTGPLSYLGDSGKWNWRVRVVYVYCGKQKKQAWEKTSDDVQVRWEVPIIGFTNPGGPSGSTFPIYGPGSWVPE